MTPADDLATVAREIIRSNWYLTLGTADEVGQPWVSPVYYAAEEWGRFHWVSSPEATHSRNLAARPQVSMVIFDSRVPPGAGQGVYMAAMAQELSDEELDHGIDVFTRSSQAHGLRAWTLGDVTSPAPHRLYRAIVSQHWVLDPGASPNRRNPVTP